MLHVYNCILLKMSTWGWKHVEENSILWINNNRCIKLVINIESIHTCVFARRLAWWQPHLHASEAGLYTRFLQAHIMYLVFADRIFLSSFLYSSLFLRYILLCVYFLSFSHLRVTLLHPFFHYFFLITLRHTYR